MEMERTIKMSLNYVFGPNLYMEYGTSRKMYEPGRMEKIGDQILSTLSMMWNIIYFSSPLIVTFLYRRGYFVTDSISLLAKLTISLGIILLISLSMRGFGRSRSRSYIELVKTLELAKSSKTLEESKQAYRLFDFDFRFWRVDFDVNTMLDDHHKKTIVLAKGKVRSTQFVRIPFEIVAYLAMHTFGIRLLYPGSLKLLQSYMRPMLVAGRAKIIGRKNGKRYKIKTVDRNEIDTIFVDNRSNEVNGKTLVICSEGNSGFYEIGSMGTPIALKYSVMGWNHPGFEGSTGKPFPDQDKNAIDAVLQFAINKIGFAVEDIILYGWSIGGFSTMWAASFYPEVKGVILDATFDDILYLAQSRIPACLAGVVKIAIRDYCNLNNAELIPNYNGPILIIRRTQDEIIAKDYRINTNRGNYLTLALLKYRYPKIFQPSQLTQIKNILSKPVEANNTPAVFNDNCLSRLTKYASDQGKSFPMQIGGDYTEEVRHQMADFLLRIHFRDYNSTHCTPLPSEYFNIPWDVPMENRFDLIKGNGND